MWWQTTMCQEGTLGLSAHRRLRADTRRITQRDCPFCTLFSFCKAFYIINSLINQEFFLNPLNKKFYVLSDSGWKMLCINSGPFCFWSVSGGLYISYCLYFHTLHDPFRKTPNLKKNCTAVLLKISTLRQGNCRNVVFHFFNLSVVATSLLSSWSGH